MKPTLMMLLIAALLLCLSVLAGLVLWEHAWWTAALLSLGACVSAGWCFLVRTASSMERFLAAVL